MIELVEKYMSLAKYEADKFFRRNTMLLEYEDLLQEAYYGLIKASEGYEEGKGAIFATYATRCIQHRLKRVHGKSRAVGGGDTKLDGLLRKVLFDSKGKIPTAEEIVSKYKVNICSAKSIIMKYRSHSPVELDKQFDDSNECLIDILDLGNYKRPDSMYERKDLEETLLVMIKLLPLEWKELIDRRYFKEMKLNEMAKLNKSTVPAVYKRLNNVINTLRGELDD